MAPYYDIQPQINENTLTFKPNAPHNLSIEINDDIFHNLYLFANPVDEYKPNPKDKNLIYFDPGIHHNDNAISFVLKIS